METKQKNQFYKPILAGIAAGLYPVLFYYKNNFTMVNSWEHLGFFVGCFIAIPVIVFYVASKILPVANKIKLSRSFPAFLSIFTFTFLLMICLHAGIEKKISVVALLVSFGLSLFLWKFHKKIVQFQLLLAFIGFLFLVPTLIKQFSYNNDWKELPDSIANVEFTTKPNVYFIQPDGYVNFSEIDKGYYNIDNSDFKSYLEAENFKTYDDFRSNYGSTLSTNAAIFNMKHHFYNGGADFSEGLNARDAIIGNNVVLNAFKNNGYTTYFLSHKPYLLLNRPKMAFDVSNYSYKEIPYIASGLTLTKDVVEATKTYVNDDVATPKFFFIEFLNPGHIQNKEYNSDGVEGERKKWIASLDRANTMLKELIAAIKLKDPNGLIMILADHGGYVGLEYAELATIKTQDRDLIYSMFSSILAIQWPNNEAPTADVSLKTSVNVFRVLFSYLAQDASYTNALEPNDSYIIIDEGAKKGVYNYIDDAGSINFKKH